MIPRAKKGAEGQPPGHSSHILCMAISSDGKYLVRRGWPRGGERGRDTCWVPVAIVLIPLPQASGDRSKLILIWEAQSCQHLYTFTGHRDAVSVGAVDVYQATKWAGLGRWGAGGRGSPCWGNLCFGSVRGTVKDIKGVKGWGELGGTELAWGAGAAQKSAAVTCFSASPPGPDFCLACCSPGPLLLPLPAPLGAGVPQRHPPALQHVPRPLGEGVERGGELLRGDAVSVRGERVCGCVRQCTRV